MENEFYDSEGTIAGLDVPATSSTHYEVDTYDNEERPVIISIDRDPDTQVLSLLLFVQGIEFPSCRVNLVFAPWPGDLPYTTEDQNGPFVWDEPLDITGDASASLTLTAA